MVYHKVGDFCKLRTNNADTLYQISIVSFNIAILGTGNLAWHLGLAFENAGHVITDIYNRDLEKARHFALNFFNANATNRLDFSDSNANIFILVVSDDSIMDLAPSIYMPQGSILVHCSGSVPLSALGYARTENTGVFYPLQTFSKGKRVDFSEIPIGIEAENKNTQNALQRLAKTVSTKVIEMDSKARRTVHLSAVFACNFTNHMLSISKEILTSQEINFELLHPLIVETLNKSLNIGPENAQTGPAARGDMETLDKHYEMLRNAPDVAEIYRIISQHIIDKYAND